ncbi:MAG: bifunctional YncE family protein/alkaline phosphatase family protein [Acidobacteriaceae bacterium]|nr:bifunctional YncE family protein/alkaline phosphatase family protein [Acidobacteriaceae bacterium]
MRRSALSVIALLLTSPLVLAQQSAATLDAAGRLNLPSSKQLGSVPGDPQRLNSLPISMAVSPDGRYVVTVNAGYGTYESKYLQSLAVMDARTGKVMDFPDDRTARTGKQTLYSGLAFSRDGRHIYASMASLTDPGEDGKTNIGNGVAVYGFSDGRITPERMIPILLQPLAGSRRTKLIGDVDGAKGVPYPAAIAVLGHADSERLLVADNLSDDVLLIDATTGKVVTRFDLAESDAVPSTYPVAVAASPDGRRGFVALWNASEVVELDLVKGSVGRRLALLKPADPVKPGTHPCALQMSPDGRTLYVALSNRDAVAALDISGSGNATKFAVKGYFDTRLPGQSYFGAEPVALSLGGDGGRLYVANMASDAVAVIDPRKLTSSAAKHGMVEPLGFIPTEWMPMSMALIASDGGSSRSHGKLVLATAKGRGAGPNNFFRSAEAAKNQEENFTYIATLLYGSLAAIDLDSIDLKKATEEVLVSNRMKAAQEKLAFAAGGDPIKHVIYIIKENRTYDQVFGDLKQDGKPVGNGDPRLAMYGESVTPNQHKLALQFGVLDNFFDSGEVSGDGHVWSNAAIGTDYLEKTWQQSYRNDQRTYDYEGVVANGYPLQQKIPDVNEPSSGYMWGNVAAHGKTHYNFGEYIASTFCDAKKSRPQDGPLLAGAHCRPDAIQPGEAIPEEWGGGVNKWAWPIPLLARNVATKPELVGHFAAESPDFNLSVPDQIRASVLLKHLQGWIADRTAGTDTMPNYITVRMGNDHTAGTRPGGPTPKSSVADNDLAIGRIVEAVSHSIFWDDTAIFILEDDAQNGADHVDAHRSLALVISKYAPRAVDGGPFVDSRFYSTVSVVRTMETLLQLPPMNNNDALAPMIGSMFTGPGDQKQFVADTMNRDNGLIYTANKANAVGAQESMKMDFTHEDRANPQKLNVILWRDAMGNSPVPLQLMQKQKKAKKDDDD